MDIIISVVVFLFLWTASSVIWFMNGLRTKNYHKNRWYDLLLSPPTLLIAYVIGFIINPRIKRND